MRIALKTGFLAVVSLILVGALAASAASAHEFHFEVKPAILLGEQTTQFSFENSSAVMTCNIAHFETTTTTTSQGELKLSPTHTNCSILGLKVTIKMNGCIYALSGQTDKNEDAQFKLECETGKKMEIVVGEGLNLCTAKFASQTASKGVHYTNSGTGSSRIFNVTFTATSLSYETIGETCGFFGTGTDENLTGTVTFKGFNDVGGERGKQVGVWVE